MLHSVKFTTSNNSVGGYITLTYKSNAWRHSNDFTKDVDELMSDSNKEIKKEYFNKFNNLFDNMRQKSNKNTEIIEYNATDNFSSLDNAFNILEVSDKDYIDSGMSIEQKMAAYNNEFNNLKLPEPTNKTLPKFSTDFEKNKLN